MDGSLHTRRVAHRGRLQRRGTVVDRSSQDARGHRERVFAGESHGRRRVDGDETDVVGAIALLRLRTARRGRTRGRGAVRAVDDGERRKHPGAQRHIYRTRIARTVTAAHRASRRQLGESIFALRGAGFAPHVAARVSTHHWDRTRRRRHQARRDRRSDQTRTVKDVREVRGEEIETEKLDRCQLVATGGAVRGARRRVQRMRRSASRGR